MIKLNKIFLTNFNFDTEKELAIYTYLCKEKLTHRQQKLLSPDTQFAGYHSWKNHIISKFKVYTRSGLIELSRCLNLSLRNTNKFNSFTQGFWMSCISSCLSLSINELCDYLQPNLNPVIQFFTILLFVPLLAFYLLSAYNNYSSEGQRINFYQDVKEIIDEMIEAK